MSLFTSVGIADKVRKFLAVEGRANYVKFS